MGLWDYAIQIWEPSCRTYCLYILQTGLVVCTHLAERSHKPPVEMVDYYRGRDRVEMADYYRGPVEMAPGVPGLH